MNLQPVVFGPVRTSHGFEFAVKRFFVNEKLGKLFTLKFKIVYEERNNKWHHFEINKWQKETLCYERHYAPTKDCACIKLCKKRMEEWILKNKAEGTKQGAQLSSDV